MNQQHPFQLGIEEITLNLVGEMALDEKGTGIGQLQMSRFRFFRKMNGIPNVTEWQ
ncbi:MAG TPA: hypothetical protein VGH47_05270 [Xanthobacteraceae bacterium]|jgi:hypothetical protein